MIYNKETIISTIKDQKNKLQSLGVSTIGLFGSYVSGKQTENSDIDILVDFESSKYNYDNFINLCFLFDSLFENKKVEVVTKKSLSPYIGPKILKTVEYVF